MRMVTFLLVALALVSGSHGAAAPKKAATQPASQLSSIFKDGLRSNMSEAEAVAALNKAGVKVLERKERDGWVTLALDDKRTLGFKEDKLVSGSRDTMPDTPPELQKDAKVGMTEPEVQAAIEKSGVKVVERKNISGDTMFILKLSDGRAILFRESKVKSIQLVPATQPAK